MSTLTLPPRNSPAIFRLPLAPISPAERVQADLAVKRGEIDIVTVNDRLYRAVRRQGAVLGYIERATETRYVAKKMSPDRRSFQLVGEFGRFDDALASLRFG